MWVTAHIQISRPPQHRCRIHGGHSTDSNYIWVTKQLHIPLGPRHKLKFHVNHSTISDSKWATAQIQGNASNGTYMFRFQVGHSTDSDFMFHANKDTFSDTK
jgi:hypothetical protein